MNLEQLRAEAEERILDSDKEEPQRRECWNCDERKGYLKRIEEVFRCNVCQHLYYKGVDITKEGNGIASRGPA